MAGCHISRYGGHFYFSVCWITLILFLVLAFASGCASSSGGSMSTREAMAMTHLQMTDEGQRAMKRFRQRIQAGMSPSDVKSVMAELSKQSNWPDWRSGTEPNDRSFQVVDGANVEVWQYTFYREDAILKFEDDKLTSFNTRMGEDWQRMQNLLQGR